MDFKKDLEIPKNLLIKKYEMENDYLKRKFFENEKLLEEMKQKYFEVLGKYEALQLAFDKLIVNKNI